LGIGFEGKDDSLDLIPILESAKILFQKKQNELCPQRAVRVLTGYFSNALP